VNSLSKIRILYSSNAFWSSSGYGVQGRSLLPRLAELPEVGGRENIANFAWYGMQGGMHNVEGFRIYPAGADPYGNDIIQAHTQDFGANIVITLIDVWVLRETAAKVAPALWLPWLPIDHDPVPDAVLNAIQGAHTVLSYSKWGRDMLTAQGVKNEYIPHGVEPSVYRVLDDQGRVEQFRQQVLRCQPGDHLTVMVAANKGYPDRKGFQVQLRSWANFAKDKPHARLYVHTEPTTMYGGIDFPKLCANLGIGERVVFPDRYQYFKGLPPEYMGILYNSADAYLGAGMSEGFGIPLIEAQACGVPIITTDFSAMPELVRWGYKVAPADMFWTPMNAWQAWPDVHGIQDALEELYAQWHDNGKQWPLAQRLKAQDAIHGEYSWDSIVRDQWAPLMTRLAEVAPPLPGAQPKVQREAQIQPRVAALPNRNGRQAKVQPVGVQ
jgi:glycosyltransferase involved in cell wall biosynthesis